MSQSQPRRPSGPPATARVPSGAVVGVSETTPLLPSGVKRPASSPASAIPQSVPSYNAAPPSAAPPPAQPVAPLPRLSGLVGLDKPASTWTELGVLVRSSIPLSAGLMLENALNTINILIVGRLGPAELAVAGNSSLLIMVTGYPLPLALAAAFTTLSAPLYTQVEARHHIGHILQRTFLLSVITSAIVMIFWWNIGPILIALKQPRDLVVGMKAYLRAASLLLPALGLVESMTAYLQVQGIMNPPPLVLLALLPMHTGIAIFLVHYTHLGAPGAALATGITLWTTGLLLVAYSLRTRAKACWDGFSKQAWKEWGSVLWLAIPGALMFGSELWAFEVIALLAGRLGHTAVAAQAVISTLDNIVAMVPYAISIGIANRVGNLLGFGTRAIKRARRTVRAGFVLEIAVSGTTGALLLIFRNKIALIFTDDKKVAREAAEAAIFVASYQVFDGLQNVGAACLRAFGRQNVGSIIHLFGYYFAGLPLGAYLGLGSPRWGLSGLWAGAAVALAFTSAAELLFAFTIRWESEVERVQAREADELSDEDESEDDAFGNYEIARS